MVCAPKENGEKNNDRKELFNLMPTLMTLTLTLYYMSLTVNLPSEVDSLEISTHRGLGKISFTMAASLHLPVVLAILLISGKLVGLSFDVRDLHVESTFVSSLWQGLVVHLPIPGLSTRPTSNVLLPPIL